MIDTTNKKIIIQSGNQIFDIDHLPSQGGLQTSTSEIGLSTASSSTQTPVNNKPSPILTGKLTAELA